MVPVYTMEAARNFQAMDSDCNIKKGEALTLILDNQKLCLVHRKDDLPLVVPNSYVSLQTPTEEKRPGSFSKFLRERRTLRNRQKYPMSTFNLESVRPQFATVTDNFAATSFNEVDLLRDTAVLILNADPQSLYWFGVTQYGTYGLLPRNNVSMITQKGTPSLQQGCRLTAHTRKAYSSDDPHELVVRKGWNLEIVGMPELWRWQVRLSQGERKVGLLPVHVLSEVSVISCPVDGAPAEITSPLLETQSAVTPVRPPSMLNPCDMDATNLALVVRTGEETLKRRQSRQGMPLPVKPPVHSQSLNDLNRATDSTPRYVNGPQNHFSLCSQDLSVPHKLVSDEAAVPRRLEGVSGLGSGRSGPAGDLYYDSMPSPDIKEGVDALDELERMVRILRRDRESLQRSQEENQREAHHWKQTADNICRIVSSAQKTSEAMLSKSQMDLRNQYYYDYPYDMSYIRDRVGLLDRSRDKLCSNDVTHWTTMPFREEFPEEDMEGNRYNTVPRNKPIARVRRRSLVQPSHTSQIREKIEEEDPVQLTRSCSQPVLDVEDEYESLQMAELVFMSPQLSDEIITAVVDIICPLTVKRPQLHWKPILVALGLGEKTARLIATSGRSCRDQWKEALVAWKAEMGDKALTNIFLEKMKGSGNQDLYEKIVTKCTFRVNGTPTLV